MEIKILRHNSEIAYQFFYESVRLRKPIEDIQELFDVYKLAHKRVLDYNREQSRLTSRLDEDKR